MNAVKNKKKKRTVRRVKYDNSKIRKIMIGVVCAAMLMVVVAMICGIFFNNERMTKKKLDQMASEYYEGYIYENLIHGAMSKEEIENVMKRYVTKGFAPVNLRQLLLYDGRKNAKDAEFVKKFCDENETSVKFYPEEPYDKKAYRMEYRYGCEW